ncbi:MAG: SRPBCC family protein, partial [Specibacter sp.]
MKSRLYDLKSSWTVPFPREDVWAVIADPDMSWPSWWPHCSFAGPLERTATTTVSPADLLKSTTAHLDFHAPLGYTLTISVHPTKVEPLQLIEFDAGGHLVGTGQVTLSEVGAG